MSHTIFYNSETHIVESKIQGDIDLNDTKELIAELVQIAKENNCTLFLGDYRDAKIKLSIVDIYELPKITLGIYASSGVNREVNTKIFFDIDEAKKWLLGKYHHLTRHAFVR